MKAFPAKGEEHTRPGLDLLIVAHSARMLAESAARAGYRPSVIDLFGDEDTRAAAGACRTVKTFDEATLLGAANELAPPGRETSLIYGGGLTCSSVLQKLACGRSLLGNPPDVVRHLKTPRKFFALLDRLAIPYPPTVFHRPASLRHWLVKSSCEEGGMGVRFLANFGPVGPDTYFQRRLTGTACSLLFLADGQSAAPVGFNTLWRSAHDPDRPFMFAGAINRAELSAAQRRAVVEYASRLTGALGLVGLNSLDFMVMRKVCRVLEVNPRPSATLQLYDADHPGGLLQAHVDACRERLSEMSAREGPVRAFRIFYASTAIALPSNRRLPVWCADRPIPGTRIEMGRPLCTIMAEGNDRHTTAALLKRRVAELRAWLSMLPESEG